jgi:hypothetical protein
MAFVHTRFPQKDLRIPPATQTVLNKLLLKGDQSNNNYNYHHNWGLGRIPTLENVDY